MKIVNLKNYKFKDALGIYIMKGFALYEEGKGFVSLDGGKTPYSPIGGRKALQRILDTGGFTEEPCFIKPIV